MSTADTPTLQIEDLRTHFFTREGVVKAVDGVSFETRHGEVLGLVGESGSGKSVTGFSILGLVDPPGRIVGGSIRYQGRELIGRPEEDLRRLRGACICMVFQDPCASLNPRMRVGEIVAEAPQPPLHESPAARGTTPRSAPLTISAHSRRDPLASCATHRLSLPSALPARYAPLH